MLATTAILVSLDQSRDICSRPWRRVYRHPDEFLQKLIDAPDVGLIEVFAVLGKHFLHTREIYVPENRNQPDLASEQGGRLFLLENLSDPTA